MSRLIWADADFETGVSKGVLYFENENVVPWNGLLSVTTVYSGETKEHYLDGLKRHCSFSLEDFSALVEAYIYPTEFTDYQDGPLSTSNLFKKAFSFSYQTRVSENHYKIHVIFNAYATPMEFANETVSEDLEAYNFEWAFFTNPEPLRGVSKSSYFVIDSRDTPPYMMDRIAGVLYGTETTEPRLPSIDEFLFMFNQHPDIWDAGYVGYEYFYFVDGGTLDFYLTPPTFTADGGGP